MAAGAAVLCALGIAAAVLFVGRGSSGAAATTAGTTTTAPTATTSRGFAVVDTPLGFCFEDSKHGKTYVWHWSDAEEKLVKGCPGGYLP